MASHVYCVEMAVGSMSYARDLLRVEWENPLVSYPILDPWSGSDRPNVTTGGLIQFNFYLTDDCNKNFRQIH